MPVTVVQDIVELPCTAGKEIPNDHQEEADIQSEEGYPDILVRPYLRSMKPWAGAPVSLSPKTGQTSY